MVLREKLSDRVPYPLLAPPPLHLVSYLPKLLGIVSILSLNSYRVFVIILTVIDNYAIIVIIDYF